MENIRGNGTKERRSQRAVWWPGNRDLKGSNIEVGVTVRCVTRGCTICKSSLCPQVHREGMILGNQYYEFVWIRKVPRGNLVSKICYDTEKSARTLLFRVCDFIRVYLAFHPYAVKLYFYCWLVHLIGLKWIYCTKFLEIFFRLSLTSFPMFGSI